MRIIYQLNPFCPSLKKENQTFSNGVSDYPFKAQITWLVGTVTGDDYELALVTILNRINHNEGGFFNSYRLDEVRDVINTYINSVNADASFPQYEVGDANSDYVISAVATRSGITADRVKIILDQLEYATADGSVKYDRFWHPRTATKYADSRTKPNSEVQQSPIDNAIYYLKVGGIILAVGVGIYALTDIAKIAKIFKKD